MTLPVLAMLLAAPAQPGAAFPSSDSCSLCHTRIPEPGRGRNEPKPWIGPFALWRGSMMAHSAVDPYWRAKVQFEVEQAPPAGRAGIEDTCLRCHAPADQYPLRAAGRPMAIANLSDQGRDGVTCTVCHQILPDGLGGAESFTAGFRIGGDRLIFGPHADPFAMPMLHHTGYEPREAKYVRESALCGTCHTVITQPPGSTTPFLEQAPFLEWLANSYPQRGRTCQSCHMPESQAQYIAHRPPGGPFPPTRPRTPFGRHEFAGGNVVIPQLLAEGSGDERAEVLQQAAARARRQLEASLRMEVELRRESKWIEANVDLINLAGHKLPTGFPSRRLWLHLTATDAYGRTVFESGAWDGAGRLRSGEAFQPHRTVIANAAEVQIFEVEMENAQGKPTLSIIQAAGHRKDNRILPAGFSPERLKTAGFGLLAEQLSDGGSEPAPGRARTTYHVPHSPDGRACHGRSIVSDHQAQPQAGGTVGARQAGAAGHDRAGGGRSIALRRYCFPHPRPIRPIPHIGRPFSSRSWMRTFSFGISTLWAITTVSRSNPRTTASLPAFGLKFCSSK